MNPAFASNQSSKPCTVLQYPSNKHSVWHVRRHMRYYVCLSTPYTPLCGVAVCCSVLQCVAVRCSALQCVAVCCSMLQVYARYQNVCGSWVSEILMCHTAWYHMGWLRLVGSIKSYISFAKEPYKRDNILQKRPIILSTLLTVATPYVSQYTRLVGSIKLYVSFAKEPYKRDKFLQKRPSILRSLLIVATPYCL